MIENPKTEVATVPQQSGLTTRETATNMRARIEAVRQTLCPQANDAELHIFAEVCAKTGLDPFTRQICAFKTGTGEYAKMAFHVTIDGFRLIAARTGELNGMASPLYSTAENPNQWIEVLPPSVLPYACKITVYRKGVEYPFSVTAKYSSYCNPKSPVWQKMPEVMIAKCAEALALRKAFPNELSGLYSPEEMEQGTIKPEPQPERLQAAKQAMVVDDSLEKGQAISDLMYILNSDCMDSLDNIEAMRAYNWNELALGKIKAIYKKYYPIYEECANKIESFVDDTPEVDTSESTESVWQQVLDELNLMVLDPNAKGFSKMDSLRKKLANPKKTNLTMLVALHQELKEYIQANINESIEGEFDPFESK